ncbi:kinase-like protein [Pleomassaria siparia CBS 279.74]|uniref:Kinase-like protein n=1 Tax=Pleomassaria siparia CBS 279.74 TaxID=1314801 RepID=A0A6G1K8N4_9PLEO|nr:kinase-like protein [Pleomassaria siparia CBS 279.74]
MGNCPSFVVKPFRLPRSERLTHNDAQYSSTGDLIPEHEHREPPPKLVDLEVNIRNKLRLLMKQSSERENSQIILPEDLKAFWTPMATRQFYTRQRWHDREWNETERMSDYHKIIAVLILARFRDWGNFRKIFIDMERSDKNLPFEKKDLKKEDFLGSDFAQYFWSSQWVVCPLVIEELQEPYELTGKMAEQRFPYINPGEEIGSGATGTVFKQVIAARHLRYSKLGGKSDNINPRTVACKRVDEKSAETVEFENLKSLRECLSTHNRIMVNIATIIRNSSSAGKVHFILYDLAAYDLSTLLNNRPLDYQEERLIRHDSSPIGRNNSEHWWAGDLIRESQNLADALYFLHRGLYRSGQTWSLVHNDLKPENILVFYPNMENLNDRYPVGQWKIADFGLAKIKEKRDGSNAEKLHVDVTHRLTNSTSTRSRSITTAKRDPGRYTAPEVEGQGKLQRNPKSGDVWAFGCILSEVLAYAISPTLVAELRKECEKPHGIDQRFYDANTKKAKETVMAWLQGLPGRCQIHPGQQHPATPSWIADCVKLIGKTLEVNPSDRYSAESIRDELGLIAKQMHREKDKFKLVDLLDVPDISIGGRYFQHRSSSSSMSGEEPLQSPKNIDLW